jgi:DNA mismatch repair protein MutS2
VSGARAPAPPRRIDLHGLRVEEALTRVVEGIDRALVAGADRLEVLHGKGSGRVRDALHQHLASMRVVVSFELDPDNPGVTWVHF